MDEDSKRVLIIEGAHDIQAIAKLGLEMAAGWNVLTASTSYQGLALAETEQPDVILLDVDINGFTALHQIQTNTLTCHIPVILLTARVRPMDQLHSSQLGAAAVIAKPFDAVSLAQEIATALQWPLSSLSCKFS